ncbi:MAG: threonine synthase [Chitinivibrionales bacterium]|nr:threonine synthase [Chitinivibrionales bacterium]
MRYISTRDNHRPVPSATAIDTGMVPDGGLFVPESVPPLDLPGTTDVSYAQTATEVLRPLLSDFTEVDLAECIARAYNPDTFDAPEVIELVPLSQRRFVMELWHGPTAAFKDVALQIMPHFVKVVKRKAGEERHTVILVATSGDTGKAALEGFKNCPGISIVVFYPEQGVSEIQKRQMAVTDGDNTHVVAVRGNFDDCQSGVKELFGDVELKERLGARGFMLSSANSINWGRLSPQIVYYVHAYRMLVARGELRAGDPVDFCVPTGNFGNILAGYYAMCMGLPIRRLVCASNKNRILADFFTGGVYDRNREFHRTMSPSMDILLSSNLERFLFETTRHDASKVTAWYRELAASGRFTVDDNTRAAMVRSLVPGWVDEPRVLETIGKTYDELGYVLDPHTAVAVAVGEDIRERDEVPMVIDATASPYKFSGSVLVGICGERKDDEFRSIERLHELSGVPVHRALSDLRAKPIRHDTTIGPESMKRTVLDILGVAA